VRFGNVASILHKPGPCASIYLWLELRVEEAEKPGVLSPISSLARDGREERCPVRSL